jgi:hypothetical protein
LASQVGTLEWARRTRGRLSRGERAAMLAQVVRIQLATMPARAASRLGLRRRELARVDLRELRVPDSAPAREAEGVAAETQPDWMLAHAHRTYLWGAVLAAHDAIAFDEELFYIASLLHDAGLPDPARGECFTLRSAACADLPGLTVERRSTVAEAITMHLNASVPLERGAEAHLLSAGAALDVVGLRLWDVDPATRAAVVERHPRPDFKPRITAALREHAVRAPGCRAHTLLRAGFARAVRVAPFES